MEHFHTFDKLHTDVLEDKYGPIKAKILRHDKELREAHLIDSKGISRTYAITIFPKKPNSNIAKIDNKIKHGEAIGKAFRNYGYIIRKNVIDVFIVKLAPSLRKEFRTRKRYAKTRLSEFYAKRSSGKPIIYGVVAEIYSPDFREAEINNFDISQINATTEAFKKNGIGASEIWNRIGKCNDWNDLKKVYNKSKAESSNDIFKIRNIIKTYLRN